MPRRKAAIGSDDFSTVPFAEYPLVRFGDDRDYSFGTTGTSMKLAVGVSV